MFEFWAICGPVSVVWKVLPQQAHKDWMEHVCHMTMHRTNSKRYLRISEISLVDLSNTSLLTGLDEFYSGRPAIAAVSPASMPSAAIAAAPPVIDDCPPSPSIAHQPAASVAPCASQPVTNLDMLAHFGDLLLAFKKQRKWSSAKESVPLAHVTNSEDVSSWFGKYFRSPQHTTWLDHQASHQFSAGPIVSLFAVDCHECLFKNQPDQHAWCPPSFQCSCLLLQGHM
jgi:hypothetical protein